MAIIYNRVFVTPEMANEFLASGIEKQRNIRNKKVEQYADDMKHGRWRENGETIKFDKDGRMIDGQHRCSAIILAGIGVWMTIAEGIDIEAMDTIDIGMNRSLENAMQFKGESFESKVSSVVRQKLSLDNEGKSIGQSSANIGLSQPQMVADYLKHEKDYIDATRFAKRIYNESDKAMQVTEVGGIYLHLIKTMDYSVEMVEQFFERLCSARTNEKTIYSSTIKSLRNKKECKGSARIEQYIKCFNAMVMNKRTQRNVRESWFIAPPMMVA